MTTTSAQRLADSDKIEGSDRHQLEIALKEACSIMDTMAIFLGDYIDQSSCEDAISLLTEIYTNGFLVGASLGGDLGRSIQIKRQKQSGKEGGILAGEKRRAKRALTWEPIAKHLAKRQLLNDPGLSRDDLAADISNSWNSIEIMCKGHGSLLKLLKRMKDNGELPSRTKSRKGLSGKIL